ncbi:Glutamine synthetase, catalytic domain [Halorubrum vacuolatum]|uniref:Glutamine synthetase, catalytic domain n=2 Tax=Halorubrum vacuolatum TaxID=63740 RepID=A0A238VLV6_HALVU|nr:Glutamine synthetase, catalytic domain [Halorubrum vacuolatum]
MTSIRVPTHGTTRVENRIPSADANPYLVIASTLAAAIDGIETEIEPPAPVSGDPENASPRLPRTPHQALDALEADEALTGILGESLVSEYVRQKRQEIDAFYDVTTEWERRQYVEMF